MFVLSGVAMCSAGESGRGRREQAEKFQYSWRTECSVGCGCARACVRTADGRRRRWSSGHRGMAMVRARLEGLRTVAVVAGMPLGGESELWHASGSSQHVKGSHASPKDFEWLTRE